MIANPFVRLFEAPIETTLVFSYAMVLLTAMIVTWYVLGRNLMTMYAQYGRAWSNWPTFEWTLRAAGVPLILALDALLFGALIWLMTGP